MRKAPEFKIATAQNKKIFNKIFSMERKSKLTRNGIVKFYGEDDDVNDCLH